MGLLDNFKKADQAENEEAINELEESMGGLEEDNDFEVYLEDGADSEEDSYDDNLKEIKIKATYTVASTNEEKTIEQYIPLKKLTVAD